MYCAYVMILSSVSLWGNEGKIKFCRFFRNFSTHHFSLNCFLNLCLVFYYVFFSLAVLSVALSRSSGSVSVSLSSNSHQPEALAAAQAASFQVMACILLSSCRFVLAMTIFLNRCLAETQKALITKSLAKIVISFSDNFALLKSSQTVKDFITLYMYMNLYNIAIPR